ncbi:MAG: hypothetical protein H6739_09205 [Alphaproteobacteria bacterium]|nr:hypothetical protein [Alphaproteobacteria bacterium]
MSALLLFVTAALAQSTLVCEAASGPALRYETWSKSGGAYPGPGTVMETEGWSLGDVVLYSRARFYMDPEKVTGKLDWAWDPDATRQRSVKSEGMSRTIVYTAKVDVWTRDGSPIHPELPEPRATVRMRCESLEVWGIP